MISGTKNIHCEMSHLMDPSPLALVFFGLFSSVLSFLVLVVEISSMGLFVPPGIHSELNSWRLFSRMNESLEVLLYITR
jgi:hypothetical protein